MKKINLIKRLLSYSHEKQKPQRLGRYVVMLMMLLTLGVGQAWGWGWTKFESTSPATIYPGDQVTLQILLNGDGNGATYKAIGSGTTNAQANLTWNNSDTYYDYVEKAGDDNRWKFYFTPNSTGTWYWSIWLGWGSSVGDNGHYYNGSTSWNDGKESYQSSSVTVSAVPKSGSLSAESAGTTSIALSWSKNSLNDDVIIFNGNSKTPSNGSTYTVGSNNVVYKGSGTSATITGLTANTSYTFYIYSIHQTKYYSASNNATAKTDDVATPAITLTSVSPASSIVAGNDITLVGTRANSSNAISFQYTTNDGSTWTDISPKTSSTVGNATTATWTVPDAHGATQTFKFRACLAADSKESAKSSGVTVYNTRTIHVRNINDWATFKMHHWGDASPTSMPGNADNISSYGGQWKDVVILSSYTGFVLNDGASSGGHQSYDLSYTTIPTSQSVTDGSYWEFATASTYTGGAYKHALSSSSAPAAPTATTNDANEITSTTAKFNYSVNANRDKTTPGIAFKQSDDDIDAATIYSSGTKVAGSATNGNTSGSTAAQTITPGKKYYYVAYGTNGFGTSYGTVKSFVAPYKVTVSTNTGCAEITNSGVNYTNSTITVTATAATGYTFSSWSTTNGTQTSTSSEGNTNTLVFTPTAENATIQPVYTENMTTVNLVASPTGKGTFTCGDDAVTSVSAGVTTHPTVTAVPASGYRVNTSATVWSESSDYISISATNAAATTITASGAGNTATLTATFTPNNYTITLDDNNGSGGVGSATVTFDDDNFTFASSFVAPTRTGYIFQGYYTASSMDVGDQLIDKDGNWQSDTEPYTYIDEDGNWIYPNNKTLYAGWTPISYTIHYDANGGSGSMDDQVAKYEVESSLDGQNSFISTNGFTAPTGYGFYYPAHPWNTSADGTGTDIDAVTYQSTLTSTNGATVNLYAQWSGRFALKANYDGGVDGYFRVHYNTSIIEALTTLYPTRYGYLCDGYYTADEDGTKVLNGDGTVVEGNVSGYVTGGKWTYKGTQDFYAYWNQIKYNLTFDGNDCAAYVGEATGSKASMANVEYEEMVDLTPGTLAREGYTFAGWSKIAEATSPQYVSTSWNHISATDGDDVTLYAVWNAKNYTISFNALGGDCYTPSKTVAMGANYGSLPTAWGSSGYEFVGWYTRPEGGTLVTEETRMVTASDHTLYAHYEKKERVYFKNTLGWDSVFVTFDAYWDTYHDPSYGTGNSGREYRKMIKSSGNIYYYDVPAGSLSPWDHYIAFNDTRLGTVGSSSNKDNFDSGEAIFRMDFDTLATMFVPTTSTGATADGNYQLHDVQYRSTGYTEGTSSDPQYTSGYWRVYNDVASGYVLTYEKNKSGIWCSGKSLNAAKAGDSVFIYTATLEANQQYNYNIIKTTKRNSKSDDFKIDEQINSGHCTDLKLLCKPGNGYMQTTVAGDYTFKLAMADDGHMYLSVEYPFAVNDYRVVYRYTKDETDQTFASEYIKAKADAVDTISMFIHSADDATFRSLYIQKCTAIDGSGVPTWDDDYAITLPSETASGKTSGVYNFVITQDGSKAATGEAIGKYDGNYYIRCEAADGGWDQYKYRADNLMTFSEYSLSQTLSAPFSHYYCKYVGSSSTDITYTIATDYSPAICPIQEGDATIGVGNKTLPSGNPASVRFTWNQETNGTFRSYLKSAQGDGNKRFLVLHGSDNKVLDAGGNTIAGEGEGAEQMHANELLFSDTENWVYDLAFKAQPGAAVSIIARYNGSDRYLVGAADAWETIISGGTSATKYDIAAVYDFKTNRLITTWIPSGTISEEIEEVDVLIERQYQGGGTTITFGKATEESKAGSISAKRVIGALKFDYNDLVGRVASWTPDTREKLMYFVSFPFDVNVSDIFGLNTEYGDAFVVQHYNSKLRAEKGFFGGDGTETFWEDMPVDTVMRANVGYVVVMDNDYMNGDIGHVWDNKKSGEHVYLYFPSANDPSAPIILNAEAKTITLPKYECKINRTFNGGKLNHKYTDSNWNVMGVPIFQNHTGNATDGTPGAIFTPTSAPTDTSAYIDHPDLGYFYKWATDKSYTVTSAVGYTFLPMHSYLVQYAGDVTFTQAAPAVVSAPRKALKEEENYKIELQVLNSNEDMLNRTYVELRENAVDSFALNEDLFMVTNKHAVNVYTFAGTYDVSANVLSIGSHIVQVGVIVNQAGTYTFTMPSNFSGSVTLIDTYADVRTNLALGDYEVNLPKGTNDERFLLEININKVPTAIDGAGAGQGSLKDGKAHKFIMNDMLYILKDGVLYDARGNRVK